MFHYRSPHKASIVRFSVFSTTSFFKASSSGLLVSSTYRDSACEEIQGPVSSPQHLTLAQGQICPTHLVTRLFSPWG